MGRKSTRKSVKKQTAQKLESRFDCPICNHENVVQCKLISKMKRGMASCSVCESRFSCEITTLDKPIDVYHMWIDQVSVEREQ
jgi:transcription elongation factor Elf1